MMVRVIRVRRERKYRIAARMVAASWSIYEISRVLSLPLKRLRTVLDQMAEQAKVFSKTGARDDGSASKVQ